jgi:hypothetical protein
VVCLFVHPVPHRQISQNGLTEYPDSPCVARAGLSCDDVFYSISVAWVCPAAWVPLSQPMCAPTKEVTSVSVVLTPATPVQPLAMLYSLPRLLFEVSYCAGS